MSLLEKVESAAGINLLELESDEGIRYRNMLKGLLYAYIPRSKIAQLISQDIELAAREVNGALEIAAMAPQFEQLSSDRLQALITEVADMVLGLGPLQSLLNDRSVTEIMVNGPRKVFFERDGKIHTSTAQFDDEKQLRTVIDKILGPVGRRVDEQSPMVSARLPGGHRANVCVQPIALDGPYITIRKFKDESFSLEDLCLLGTIDSCIAQLLTWAVLARKNIAISGGTGSGKTTFLNALSQEIPTDDRIITIEDSAELRFDKHPHVVRFEARPMNSEGKGEITIRQIVTNSLRMRPDRIVVGECRGGEAIDMLQAMNTGHDGSLTTLHANSTAEVMNRLVTMARFEIDMPTSVIEDQVISAIDLIVHVQRMPDGQRKVVEIAEYEGADSGNRIHKCVLWDRKLRNYKWEIPSWVTQLPVMGVATQKEVDTWMQQICVS